MQYKQETGIILNHFKDVVHVTDGYPGHVEFPKDVIWQLHKTKPGYIYCLAHTHPPGMSNLSGEDMTTLQGWAQALYPFPIRMSVTTQEQGSSFRTTTYLAIWQSYEEWLEKGKNPNGREVEVFMEKSKSFTFPQGYVPQNLNYEELQDYLKKEHKKAHITSWENLILKLSYPLDFNPPLRDD